MKRIILTGICLSLFLANTSLCWSDNSKQVKLIDFALQSSVLVNESGEMISDPEYKPGIYWFPVGMSVIRY
ncbi:MAG TPA: hypothetical protein DDW27_07350 [Bacteroidales bacterium]|nr:hypothetical protein [Bacteroidales bacterium]